MLKDTEARIFFVKLIIDPKHLENLSPSTSLLRRRHMFSLFGAL
jgi:hypothetical protein